MQQHSQIIELKERLVQALDEQLNVKDIEEVNRIITTLEQISITREDLEKTRLGKYINDLRKKITDKDLAKRAKNLIKTWRDFAVGNGAGTGSNANVHNNGASTGNNNGSSALTSPYFNNDSISSPLTETTGTGKHYDNSKLTSPHPALWRVKTQHGGVSLNTPKSKPYGQQSSPVNYNNHAASFRPQAQNASPHYLELVTNGHGDDPKGSGLPPKTGGHHQSKPSRSHSLNPKNSLPAAGGTAAAASNGLSPGSHTFKNVFAKDVGVSPNAYRRRTTPPTPNSGTGQNGPLPNANSNHQAHLFHLSSSSLNSDSNCSSQRGSPLAFTFSNDSRESFASNPKNSRFESIPDDDSDSSQFSRISNECFVKSEDGSKRKHKRKLKDERDTLRENFDYVNCGGRRPKSTQELIEKFNIKLDGADLMKRKNSSFSFSANSSPGLPEVKRIRTSQNGCIDSFSRRNGFHSEENSLDGFDRVISRQRQRSSLTSPAESEVFDGPSSRVTSPDQSDDEDDDSDDDEEEDYKEESDEMAESVCGEGSLLESDATKSSSQVSPISKIDLQISELYSKLPKIRPEDLALAQQFKFDEDLDEGVHDLNAPETTQKPLEEEKDDPNDPFETYEYEEEYDEEIEVDDHRNDHEENGVDKMSFHQHNSCDISNCDTRCTDDVNVQDDGDWKNETENIRHQTGDDSISSSQDPVGIIDDDATDKNSIIRKHQLPRSSDADGGVKEEDSAMHVDSTEQNGTTINDQDHNDEDVKTEKVKNEKVKIVVRRRRKRIHRFRVRRSAVDRIANEKWEHFNGCYDKDGIWHEYDEMTSAWSLTGGENKDNISDGNVLLILPYVNCTW